MTGSVKTALVLIKWRIKEIMWISWTKHLENSHRSFSGHVPQNFHFFLKQFNFNSALFVVNVAETESDFFIYNYGKLQKFETYVL